MNISYALIIAYIIGFFVLCTLCWIFIKPIKWVLKLVLSCMFGCIVMYAVNKIFSDTVFAINPLTAMMAGVLGAPGMIISFILQSVL